LVGMYWVAHHQMFHAYRRINRKLMWLNLLFLLLVTFLPFTTSLLGMSDVSQIAVMIYGGNLSAISLLLFAMWYYATRMADLADPKLTPALLREIDHKILSMPVLALTSIAISFYSVHYSLLVYYAIILRFLLVGRMDRHLETTL